MIPIDSQSPQEPVNNTETKEEKGEEKNNNKIKNITSAFWWALAGVVLWGRLTTQFVPNDKFIVNPEQHEITANFEFDHRWWSNSYDVTIRKEWNTYMWLIEKGGMSKKVIFKYQDNDLDNLFVSLNDKMHQLNGQVKKWSEDVQEAKFNELKKYSWTL